MGEVKTTKICPNVHNIRGVIFDLDGTLVDSMWIWGDLDDEYLRGKGVNGAPPGFKESLNGMTFPRMAQLFKDKFGIDDDIDTIISDWMDLARDFYKNRIKLKDGAREFVDFLLRSNCLIGIGTTNRKELAHLVLQSNNMELSLFTSIVTSDHISKGKPHPEVYRKNLEEMQLKAEDVIVIEDSFNGCKAACNAGVKVISIDDEYSSHELHHIEEITLCHIYGWRDFEINEKDGEFSYKGHKFVLCNSV